ncbi:large subunit GTPase 1 homolog isoform X2 [Cephus cinctus]|uniref:Large subunit GTPase 1 homolog n=1 Tax=Cephus cinctus TaxID=211228 RepID=A0AAJ7W409_CEPCN|nr:large subunit GTPase 1 homolog isoform X2 [Cephus cinctus]
MGKKTKGGGANLGRALIKDRFGTSKTRRNVADPSMLHTAEVDDGYDWGRLNLQSVTEESSFQEFLSTAELAGTEFHAEKLNIQFINSKSGIGLLSKDEKDQVLESHAKNKKLLKIPRRPKWDQNTTAYELQTREKEEFLEWRRRLALLQEPEGLILTPYEKNLEFWRQLWRVVERSDVIVQIVDARNPLLFRCEDLEHYVKEVNPEKMNMILVNKADFLTDAQRQAWADYFTENNIRVAFFSASLAADKQNRIDEQDEDQGSGKNDLTDSEDEEESDKESQYNSDFCSETEYESAEDGFSKTDVKKVQRLSITEDDSENNVDIVNEVTRQHSELLILENAVHDSTTIASPPEDSEKITNSSELLTRDGLVSLFKTIYKRKTYTEGVTTIGLVGYPNVGKSSTINALLLNKKVSVSATPGKTKHFQTLFLDQDLLLCDCPGLVMPSFICTKAEMILNGILPIDQLRDHVPAVTLLGTLIPRHVIEDLYGIMLPPPSDGEDPNRPPTAEEILNAYGYNRGFMTQNGQPDNPRSARYLLKDFVNGRLLYCLAPPNRSQEEFHTFPERQRIYSANKQQPPRAVRAVKGSKITTEDLDKVFFQKNVPGVHVKGVLAKRDLLRNPLKVSFLRRNRGRR